MRLINEDRLWEVLCDYMPLSQKDIDFIGEHLPVVEAIPERKKGKWILSEFQHAGDNANGNYRYECSNCGCSEIHAKSQIVPYCWHCGADMGGEEDDTEF